MRKLFLLCAIWMQAGGQPVNIPVTASGWQFIAGHGGDAVPYGTNGCSAGYFGKCSQDLGKSPIDIQGGLGHIVEGFYTITFSVSNHSYSYPAHYKVEIDYGTQKLCAPDGWATGDATSITFVCPSPGYLIVDRQLPDQQPPQGQYHFILSFSVDYNQGDADKFLLAFTPTN